MLIANGSSWHFDGAIQVVQTHETVKRNLGSGAYSDDRYGSKVITSEGSTSIPVNNPDEPNVEMSLVKILKLHKQQCDYFAVIKPGIFDPIPQAITQILVYLGEEPHTHVRDWSPIVFFDGNWVHQQNDYHFTLERKYNGSSWFTRVTATKQVAQVMKGAAPILLSRSDVRTLVSLDPTPVHFDDVKRLFDM